ncbi:F-type H+-transporting ATPase subunit delta [Flexibacter flexilis DSM 6793]|uniref:ATP synthase subunit delta n=1 Tax=Flexibacter flexilis DSM 6793 TaxID=927664 RepID=A0A1I1GZZ3_9BACT|nr:ATP synthase F1 subunit delta [Flexibacter flexilis]SFC17075.1 F-type H+-transporting ATPase subunit delta [Flexibacter flexilis DSM 6793]
MSDIRVASRYAKSLLELAQEQGALEEVNRDMQLFTKTVQQNRDLAMAISSPIIQNAKKQAILKAVFFGKVHKLTLAIFEVLSRKNRESFLPLIAKQFESQYAESQGIKIAQIVTPFALTPELRTNFEKLVSQKTGSSKVQLTEKVDTSLIGGYVLNIGDLQIDESVKSKLAGLKVQMLDKSYEHLI